MVGVLLALANVGLPVGLVEDPDSRRILEEVRARVEGAETVSVTEVRVYEFHPSTSSRWWFRKGGFYRVEDANALFVGTPSKCWGVRPKLKSYQVFPGAPADWSFWTQSGLADLSDASKVPTVGKPQVVKWQGRSLLRIEVDARATMTKEAKVYCFFDPKTHDPAGVFMNLGSIDQIWVFKDFNLNPKIDDSMFRFVPPKGWKLAKK